MPQTPEPALPHDAAAPPTDPSDATVVAAAEAIPVVVTEAVTEAIAETAAPAAAAPAKPADLDPAACAALLKQSFPALFTGTPKPIKLRIQADIQARMPGVFSKPALSGFLRRHTGSTSYLIALTRAKHRFDLDGQPEGELSAEHRDAAVQELERRRNLQHERRAQEDAQRQQRAALLRAFETTTLTPANFCALKGIDAGALEGLLDVARRERAEAPPPPLREDHRPNFGGGEGRHGRGPQDQRGPRGPNEQRGPRGPMGPGGPGGPGGPRGPGRGPRPERRDGDRPPPGPRPPRPPRG